MLFVYLFFLFINFPWREKRKKYSYELQHQSQKADFGGKWTIFPSISSFIRRAFSIFRQKMDRPNPSETDVIVFIPAPKFCLQIKIVYSINREVLNISLVKKIKSKNKMHGLNKRVILLNKKKIKKI